MTDDYNDGDDDGLLSDDSAGDGESKDTKDAKSSDKRISDLQSKADKETARANKAETELSRLKAALQGTEAEGSAEPVEGVSAAESAVLDMARMFAYQQHPKLAEYGIPASDLAGSTPSQIAEAATATVARLDMIETKARNKMLAENGMAPEIDAGSPPPAARDFSKMSKEDFDKLLAEHGVKV